MAAVLDFPSGSAKKAVHDEKVVDLPSMGKLSMSMVEDAKRGNDLEHEMSFTQAMRCHWKAVIWSMTVSMATVMEGYDINLIGNFFGLPSFQMKYGSYYPGIGYQVSAKWQAALGLSSQVGIFIGILASGYLIERFGYKKVMLFAYTLMTGFIFITFFAPSVEVLFVGELLSGFPWGLFSVIGPAYASDVCPAMLRGYLIAYINLSIVIGQWIASGVLESLVNNATQWSYRVPFAIQWMWPVPLFCIVFFAPESPWWLVRRSRLQEAEVSVRRLTNASLQMDAKNIVAMMVHTNSIEEEMGSGSTYLDCFKGVDLRRTEISCLGWLTQIISEFVLPGFLTYFFEQAGLPVVDAFKLSVGSWALAFLGTVLSWFLIRSFGRRTIFVCGLSYMCLSSFIIAFMALGPSSNIGLRWGQAALLLVYIFVYDFTLGPICFVLASETSSTRLRGKTIALARDTYYIGGIVNSVVSPYILNPTQGNWKGLAGFLTGGLSLIMLVWAYFRVPECKGRTYEEVDLLFKQRVSARNFKGYYVDAYAEVNNPQ